MTVVVGTAGHIDHGKTSLLRALTGIDADRLPEERRRGMTIDVGYAHLALDDGTAIDFVDVPGHDRLVGNMLVGAGEVDAALLVVAADDGVRPQTLEHLELLDALRIRDGLAVVTKWDLISPDDPRRTLVLDDVSRLLDATSLAGALVLPASAVTGEGLGAVREALLALRDRAETRPRVGPVRLAIDRAFAVRGRGTVVTGSLRGGVMRAGGGLRVEPGGRAVRVRELQVHGRTAARASAGRVAVNVTGVEAGVLRRGLALTAGHGVVASDRLLVALVPPAVLPADLAGRREVRTGRPLVHDETVRLHVGTEQVTARVRRSAREAADADAQEDVVRLVLEHPVALTATERFILRRPAAGETAAGGRILDPLPASGVSRRRATPERVTAVVAARGADAVIAALVALHGVMSFVREADLRAAWERAAAEPPGTAPASPAGGQATRGSNPPAVAGARRYGRWLVAVDVIVSLEDAALEQVELRHAREPLAPGLPLAELRPSLVRRLRRAATLTAADAGPIVDGVIEGLLASRRLAREGDVLRDPRRAAGLPEPVLAAMARLEAALDVPAPPPLPDAIRSAGCSPEGVRALESSGRIVRVDASLAWAAPTYRRLEELALTLAAQGPLTPAAFRDATGTSRKYSLAILEDLDRRGVLRRTPEGHVAPGWARPP